MTDITALTMHELIEALTNGSITSVQTTEAYLQKINEAGPVIQAYLTVTEEKALADAAASDTRRQTGMPLSPIDGVPMALKDVFCTNGIKTTAGSKILANFVPPYDAVSWQKLEKAGAILLGKLNLDEFAIGSGTEGSAAAVTANLAAFALGTDTDGGVRIPAGCCGCVGLKPTYGRISRSGIISYSSSLEQTGILAKDVRDTALILQYIADHDSTDSISAHDPVGDYAAACDQPIKGLKIGLPKEYLTEDTDPEIITAVKEAAAKLAASGAEIIDVSLPHTRYGAATSHILACAEASSNLARYDGVRYGLRDEDSDIYETYEATRGAGFGDEVKLSIILGTYMLSAEHYDAYYHKALQVRTLIKADFDYCFAAGIDCLLTPVAPAIAYKTGEKTGDLLAMYMDDICTAPANLAGLPAMSVPYGKIAGMPMGLQLIGAPFGEEKLFTIGCFLETIKKGVSL